jgi:hypothetical protein
MAPRALSTNLVIISLIALDLALMSIAQMPSTTLVRPNLPLSRVADRSEKEPVEDGEDDLVVIYELGREGLSGE